MAATDSIIKINPQEQSQQTMLETINKNFQILTERIKEQNINISFLDLLCLDTVWTSTYATDADQRKQQFINQVWNTLGNYRGVFIQYTPSATEAAFTWLDNKPVNNGDYLVKLPGSQCIHIPGQPANFYVPTSYDMSNGAISYTMVTTASAAAAITNIPTYAQSGYKVTTGIVGSNGSFNSPATYTATRWYFNGEEVLWDGSYCTNTNDTGLMLSYIVIY